MNDRNLTTSEINMLRSIYGNSIDYSKITLNTGTLEDGNATTTYPFLLLMLTATGCQAACEGFERLMLLSKFSKLL
jgi:hypothetical protein